MLESGTLSLTAVSASSLSKGTSGRPIKRLPQNKAKCWTGMRIIPRPWNKELWLGPFSPKTIHLPMGSSWQPEREGECFNIFWRDKEHPTLEVLPPLQMEMNSD